MRIYYAFSMKEEIKKLYEDHPLNLYLILRNLYFMREADQEYAVYLYKQMINKLNKSKIYRDLFIQYHNTYTYSKNGEKHIINNLYKDEVSVLTVKNSYLLITTNQNNTSFFQILDQYASDFFICDFSNMDYFWLSSLKMLATSNAV